MPVEIKKRRADCLDAAILRAVFRNSRTSRFMSSDGVVCFMIVMLSPGEKYISVGEPRKCLL
jgi:hypothetical protein